MNRFWYMLTGYHIAASLSCLFVRTEISYGGSVVALLLAALAYYFARRPEKKSG